MFTVLCWLFLTTFSSVFGNCWFCGKTRNAKEPCYGRIGPLSPGLARAGNVPPETLICLRHRRIIESQDSRCSSPLLDKHSNKLTEIPVRVYEILDNEGKGKENYRPGSKWCHACKREFYSTSEAAMRKRKKVNLTLPFSSINLLFFVSVTWTTCS